MSKTAMTHALDVRFRIWLIGEFEFVSDFGFRVSDFSAAVGMREVRKSN